MSLEKMVASLTPETYDNLKYAVETGKWKNGTALSPEQRENALQLVFAYQSKVEQSGEHFTIGADGEMVIKSKRELKQAFAEKSSPEVDIARFKQDDI